MKPIDPIKPATFLGKIGIARADITPPSGIYSRAWGAALHDVADGIHMPLTATVMAILQKSGSAQIIVSMDACYIGSNEDWKDFQLAIALAAGLDEQTENVILSLEHTHAAPPLDRTRSHLPGGQYIEPYMAQIRDALIQATQEAITNAIDAQLVIDIGTCSLAKNRDLQFDDGHFACGFNPQGEGDDTLLVGRITNRETGDIIGTIVNYACHPTTLAWENTLISPDYVGAMRSLVEDATGNVPCLFLQGASGELSARDGHQGETAVAERQGRQVGYAVLSTLEGMIPAEKQMNFGGIIESGARLAYWRPAPLEETPQMSEVVMNRSIFAMPIKHDWPSLAEFETLHEQTEDRAIKERYFRRIIARKRVGDGSHVDLGYSFLRIGNIIIVTTPTEMYSDFQIHLRDAFSEYKVIVCNLTNGSLGYVVPANFYDTDLYQADVTPFAEDGLMSSIEFSIKQIKALIND